MTATRIKPAAAQMLTLEVLHRERVSPTYMRVTLGGEDLREFEPMGFDQWFRLFLPVTDASLSRLPRTLDTMAYLRYLAISKTDRPVLRNYTVRAFREAGQDGPELDIDFVLHGDEVDGGPAASWARSCSPGDPAAILDEGVAFNPPSGRTGHAVLVADESAAPAAAAILADLPPSVAGDAVIEVPARADIPALEVPTSLAVTWVVREEAAPGSVPGTTALQVASALSAAPSDAYRWVGGEQALASGMRRHWVHTGVPKDAISFCGYWRSRPHR